MLLASAIALLAVPAAAPGVGVPPTFPRTIAILSSTDQFHATRFEVSTRATHGKVRVTVRVTAAGVGRARGLVISVGPCTRGTPTSPLCKPTSSARITATVAGTSVTRSFLVARPPARHDALRVTLTPSGQPVPFLPERVGGGGGLGEILLNGGAWGIDQGSRWGIVVTEPAGVTISGVKFNSRTYAWGATSEQQVAVSTKVGYEGQAPRWDFANTMRAGTLFGFRRTPASPIYDARAQTRAFSFRADIGTQPLFTLRVSLPPWRGGA
ncbi:MAG TPA: hypothetical protein VFY32_06230 [Solirubrobacteraceae bacterium]|nr:hypothetical protein [Solirubrobacteraceae bacterium]